MKSLRKALVPVSCFLLALPLANAQSGDQSASSAPPPAPADGSPPPPPPAEGGGQGHWHKRPDPLASVSNLTDAQKAQIKALRQAAREKVEALPDDDDKREAMRGIMRSTSDQIRALLTPDQQTQYDAALKRMMHGHRPPPPGDANGQPPAPPPPAPPSSAPSS